VPLVAELNRGRLAKLLGGEGDFEKSLPHLQAMRQAVMAGDGAAAVREYDALPAAVRKDKTIMLLRTTAAAKVDRATYHTAMDEYLAAFPNDPSALMVSIDALLAKGKYDELLANLDKLDAALGGDPHLDLLRAAVARKQNDPAKAEALLDKAIAAEPDTRQPYFVRIELALADRDFDGTARLLTAAERDAHVVWSDLRKVPVYAEFVKSDAYQRWAAAHAPPPPPTAPATRPSTGPAAAPSDPFRL